MQAGRQAHPPSVRTRSRREARPLRMSSGVTTRGRGNTDSTSASRLVSWGVRAPGGGGGVRDKWGMEGGRGRDNRRVRRR